MRLRVVGRGSRVAKMRSMQTLSNDDLCAVLGGAGAPLTCTADNPTGKPPQQYMETSHAGPSTNQRVMDATNTLTSRGMSMLNDGRPSMPDQW
jgi:hypothetical protein